MSQPVAWIAKVKMEESKFKKLLKTKPIDQLVVAIEETLFNNHPEYYIFRYIKKEAAVFVCFFFNHGNEHSLKETMEWLPMEAFSLYGDKTEESFVFSTIDAANFNKEDICTAYCLKNTGFEEISEIPDVVWEQFQKDMYSYFFKEVEKDFANNFYKGRIVDKSIVKRCKALSEQRRIKNVLSNLDKASFEHPLYIFDRYYFNGTYVYHQFGQCSILKEIDPYTFVQRPFGASDSAQVVIEGKAVKTDPIHFKKLQKSESCYYKNKEHVFNHQLEEIPEADALSFKMIDEYHCTDINAVYFLGNRIDKGRLGHFKIHPTGYFNADKLLIGDNEVWFGKNVIDVDAKSFKVLETIERKHQGIYGCVIYLAEDQRSKMILLNERNQQGHFDHYKLIRTHSHNGVLQEIENQDEMEMKKRKRLQVLSKNPKDNEDDFCGLFTQWIERYFEESNLEHRRGLDRDVFLQINNHFYSCFKLKRYRHIINIYEKIKETAWLNPYLFHHTACAYTALERYEEAVEEIRKALIFGYEHCDKLFSDEDLKPLHLKDSFAVLKKGFEADMYKQASLELLEKINALDPEQWGTKEFATNFVYQFYFYDVPQLERLEREDEVYFQKYKNLLQRFFDVYFLQDELGYSNENVYKTYKDYESVHPCAHYLMLKNVFRNAHQYGGHVDLLRFSNVTEGIKRLKRSLDNSYYKERNERAIEKLKDDGFFNYVLQMG